MNVLVIGLGSMGCRRIRLMRKLDDSINIVGFDINQKRMVACESTWNIATSSNLEYTLKKGNIDCVFVCTSPLSHNEVISKCLRAGKHVFTELNLVPDGYAENVSLANSRNLVLFLSSTFLYRDEIKYINNLVWNTNCMLNYSYHIGQYLPDWHPWEDYTEFFVANNRTNACREILAVELPWLLNTFGEVERIEVLKSKMSSLQVDYDDNFMILIKHTTGHKGVLTVDIVSRKAVRNFELFGEQLYLTWDGSPNNLCIYDFEKKQNINFELYQEADQLENYSSFVVENAYLNEIMSFFEAIHTGKPPLYNFEKDQIILEIIDRIGA